MVIIKRLLVAILTVTTLSSSQLYTMNQEIPAADLIRIGTLNTQTERYYIGPEVILAKIQKLLNKNGDDEALSFILGIQKICLLHNKTLALITNDEESILHLACREGDTDAVRVFLKAMSYDREELRKTLHQSEPVMKKSGRLVFTANSFYWAVYYNQEDILHEMLKSAHENGITVHADRLLNFTIRRNRTRMMVALLQALKNGYLSLTDTQKADVLEVAIAEGALKMVKTILQAEGQDPWLILTTPSSKGVNPLSCAVINHQTNIVTWIIDFVGDSAYELANLKNINGKSACDLASFWDPYILSSLKKVNIKHEYPKLFPSFERI